MPLLADQHVSTFTIVMAGQPIATEFADRVREVRIVSSLASADVCTITILLSSPDPGDPWDIDRMPFEVGKRLEIKLGAADALRPKPLFTGEVVTVEPEFGASGIQVLVRALDLAHKLHRSRHTRTFQKQTLSEIVRKVCQEAGLRVSCDATRGQPEFVQQSNETDWDFIARLADRVGFEFVVVDGVVRFRRPRQDPAPLVLTYQVDLVSFRPRMTSVQQVESVEVRAFDPKTKRTIVGTSKAPEMLTSVGVTRDAIRREFSGSTVLVATEPVRDNVEANDLAKSLLDRMGNQFVTADGLTIGNPDVRAGATIDVRGVGRRFGGQYRVHTAIHTLRGGGVYETRFTNAPAYTISGTLGTGGAAGPPAFGSQLVIGVVTNNNDPESMGRVKVQYPALGDAVEGAWARIASPSAGRERGLMMLPQPNEEVLVAFEHGDVTRPYVIGSLFNGKDVPGTDLLSDRDGSFSLRSDQRVRTSSRKATELKSEDTLTATSQKAMKLESKDAVDVQATQALTLKGGTQVTISTDGSQLKISAPAGMLEISAANLKLSASGVVQISGSQVMLG